MRLIPSVSIVLVCCGQAVVNTNAFTQVQPSSTKGASLSSLKTTHTHLPSSSSTLPLFRRSITSSVVSATASAASSEDDATEISILDRKWEERVARVKELGGPLTFMTPVGAFNPYGLYYGITSIALGLIWYAELTMCKFLYFISRNKFDSQRRIPVFFSQIWGTLLMALTRGFPEFENMHILKDFYKTKRAAMFVANHNSWQDIPFLGYTIGWRNYKIIAKKELGKIPILSSAIYTGGNVVVDRSDRRSQLMALKKGIQWLKDGVHLCTFPEGTRSKSGRMNKFKNGAFKMAHKAGAPVIPLSIVSAGDIMPVDFMFPIKGTKNVAKVIVHEPIESVGKTEEELANAVRKAIISGLPECQRPLDE